MVLRGAGEVGCAHCTKPGAIEACPICTRLVCAACAASWATCESPSGREVQLGMSARVRDVDPSGRYALVSHWREPLRIFDLRRLRWVDGIHLPRTLYLWARAYPPRLTRDGRLIHADLSRMSGEMRFVGFRSLSLSDHEKTWVDQTPDDNPAHGTAMSAVGEQFSYVSTTQRVVVVPLATNKAAAYDPLPRKVIQAHHVDGERELLAAGSWNEIALGRMVGGRFVHTGYQETARVGNVRWIALGGPWIACAVTELGHDISLEIRRIADDGSIGRLEASPDVRGAYHTAALSSDGHYIAVALGRTVRVIDLLGTNPPSTFEHSDDVNLVTFAADDHLLVIADTDNRVVLRPRTPTGYTAPVVSVEVS